MENLLTKQGPQGAYNTDLHELEKDCHLTTFSKKTHFMRYQYTKLNVCEDLEFIIQKYFFPLDHKVFVYHLNSCLFLIYANRMKAANFRLNSSC